MTYLNPAAGQFRKLARAAAAVDELDMTVDSPPTQAQVQDIADKIDELIAALTAAGLKAEAEGEE